MADTAENDGRWMTLPERIDEIDRMLFDAGVAILHATDKKTREYADRLVTDARVQLNKLRSRLD
jgi:hypothetical protein